MSCLCWLIIIPVWPRMITDLLRRPILLLLLAALLLPAPAMGQVRIKDIADVEGVRDNQLVGYGLIDPGNNSKTSAAGRARWLKHAKIGGPLLFLAGIGLLVRATWF